MLTVQAMRSKKFDAQIQVLYLRGALRRDYQDYQEVL